MCTLDPIIDAVKKGPERTRRRRLWEIKSGWHCSIVGTCLSMSDLQALYRKTRIRVGTAIGSDFHLHSLFVQEAVTKNRISKLMNKLLDKKHAAIIRQFQNCKTTEDLRSLWDTYSSNGKIPGAFWAVMTHPAIDEKLAVSIYGEVHMLSHLVGSAKHADLRALRRMEQEVSGLRDAIDRDGRRYREKISEKDRFIKILQAEAVELKSRAAAAAVPMVAVSNDKLQDCLNNTRNDLIELKYQSVELKAQQTELEAEKTELETQNQGLLDEIRLLELAVAFQEQEETGATCPFDLNGKCILYVGGRLPQICHLRKLVNQWNGELLHHDGGVERSIDELARTVSKADTVVFPTDCVSHSAIYTVKRICRQNMKPYVPLRTTGAASLVAGLKKGFAENHR